MKKVFEDLYNRIENAVKKYWMYGLGALGLLMVGIVGLGIAYWYWPSKKVEVVSTVTTTNTTPELVNGSTNTLSLKEALLQSQIISNLQVQLAEARRQASNAITASSVVPATATNIVVTVPAEVLRAVPTTLPTPPSNGMAFGVGIVQGDLNLNIGNDGSIAIGDKKNKKVVHHPEGMPERPAYTTNILDSALSPSAGLEIRSFRKVPPGDGVRFTKPPGWTVVAGVYTTSGGVKVFAAKNAFKCFINVGSQNEPEWIESEFADQRQTPIKAESFWILSTAERTTGRTLDVMFILTPTPAE